MPSFDGVFLPLTTPFSGDDVAPSRLAANLGRWNAVPLAGSVVLGSTGEFPMLNEAERDRILTSAREAIPRDKLFLVGTGTNSALDLQGFYGGPCRSPLGTPDGDAIEDIKEVLATAGLL